MSYVIQRIKLFFEKSSERLLASALIDLDELATRIDKTIQQAQREIEREQAYIIAERTKLAQAEQEAGAKLAVLTANGQRAQRIFSRVAEFVS